MSGTSEPIDPVASEASDEATEYSALGQPVAGSIWEDLYVRPDTESDSGIEGGVDEANESTDVPQEGEM